MDAACTVYLDMFLNEESEPSNYNSVPLAQDSLNLKLCMLSQGDRMVHIHWHRLSNESQRNALSNARVIRVRKPSPIRRACALSLCRHRFYLACYRRRLSNRAWRSSSSVPPPPPPGPAPPPPPPIASATRPSATAVLWRPEGVSPNYCIKTSVMSHAVRSHS